jgi:hypothetical protein
MAKSGGNWKDILRAQHEELSRLSESAANGDDSDSSPRPGLQVGGGMSQGRNGNVQGKLTGKNYRNQDNDNDDDDIMTMELDDKKITADIDRLLRRPPLTTTYVSKAVKNSFALASEIESGGRGGGPVPSFSNRQDLGMELNFEDGDGLTLNDAGASPSARTTPRGGARRPSSANATRGNGATTAAVNEHLPNADLPADTQLRFLTAKVKMLTKQLDDTNELRREFSEQCSDLQKQLKNEREENKNLKKR